MSPLPPNSAHGRAGRRGRGHVEVPGGNTVKSAMTVGASVLVAAVMFLPAVPPSPEQPAASSTSSVVAASSLRHKVLRRYHGWCSWPGVRSQTRTGVCHLLRPDRSLEGQALRPGGRGLEAAGGPTEGDEGQPLPAPPRQAGGVRLGVLQRPVRPGTRPPDDRFLQGGRAVRGHAGRWLSVAVAGREAAWGGQGGAAR